MQLRPPILNPAGRPDRRSRGGFTMIEIALCLGIIGFALVAIIGVLPAGLSAQKENREESVINLEATYLMDVLSTGAKGADDLTNAILSITNTFVRYDEKTNFITADQSIFTPTRFALYVPLGSQPNWIYSNYLAYPANIVGLLSTPKYTPAPGGFSSNTTVADFRALSSPLTDLGTNQVAQDFSFHYRLSPEWVPYAAFDQSWTNNNMDYLFEAVNLQTNLTQFRLRFNWPVLPNGALGNNRRVFRTLLSGTVVESDSLVNGQVIPRYFVDPHTFSAAP